MDIKIKTVKQERQADCLNIENFLKEIYYPELSTKLMSDRLKFIHKATYGFVKIKDPLNEKILDSYELEEIFSNYLSLISYIPNEDTKITNFLIRNSIDNFRRYIKKVFKIEFRYFEDFINFLKTKSLLPVYLESIEVLAKNYSNNSNYIHSTTKNNCNLINGMKNIRKTRGYKNSFDSAVRVIQSITYIFLILFPIIFEESTHYNRRILKECLGKKYKNELNGLF